MLLCFRPNELVTVAGYLNLDRKGLSKIGLVVLLALIAFSNFKMNEKIEGKKCGVLKTSNCFNV